MLRRRQINANPARRLRSVLAAAAWPLRRVAWAFEDRILGGGGELLRGAADLVRWPFERLAWLLERHLVWPLRERTAGSPFPGRSVGAGALGAIGLAATLTGVLWLSAGDGSSEPGSVPAPVAAVAPAPEPPNQEQEPTLRGAPPSFGIGEGVGVADATSSAVSQGSGSASEDVVASEEGTQPGDSGAATASSGEPVPAGPAAMKVARRFAEAFVFYEIGERPARAKTVFGETTTPQLAEALAERPPRQPQAAKVPQARVVNLVPGPRVGKAYTVSVALLRVGLTSELRLEMEKKSGAWLVTDVRG